MILAISVLCLIGFYYDFNNTQILQPHIILAIVVVVAYLGIYIYLPPELGMSSSRMGLLYEYLPVVSFGAILFPNLNRHHTEAVTSALGWCGLISTMIILLIFKIYIW